MTESTARVYCTGADLNYATELVFNCQAANGNDTQRVVASLWYETYAEAAFSNLAAGTTYTLWAEAVTASGSVVTSREVTFTTKAPSTSHRGWLELPAKSTIATAQEYVFQSGVRNYTAYYDTETYSSLWVAYPLAADHMGSLSRPSSWEAAPGIGEGDQINVWDGSYGVNVGSTLYARGHQIANSDRNGVEWMQTQTFYAINSTPQIQDGFNGSVWNSLEQALQNEAQSRSDSLYIVTGPVYRTVGGSESVKMISPQHDTKECPVPNYYFKAALKIERSGNQVTAASAVGFWFAHQAYASGTSYTSFAVSVDEIERLTGFDLFANLPDAIEQAAEQNSSWSTFTGF